MEVIFKINGKMSKVNVDGNTPLLWVIREELRLRGTKFGCGKGVCGACTVHLNGEPIRTCVLPVMAVSGQEITTIEGLKEGDQLHPVQQAWVDHNVPQCGYCQSGQIMAGAALYNKTKGQFSDKEVVQSFDGHICRCGTYQRIKEAMTSLKTPVTSSNDSKKSEVNA